MCSGRSGAKSYAAPIVDADGRGCAGVEDFVNLSERAHSAGSDDARATAAATCAPP